MLYIYDTCNIEWGYIIIHICIVFAFLFCFWERRVFLFKEVNKFNLSLTCTQNFTSSCMSSRIVAHALVVNQRVGSLFLTFLVTLHNKLYHPVKYLKEKIVLARNIDCYTVHLQCVIDSKLAVISMGMILDALSKVTPIPTQ